jgi:hypothetical protein
MPVADNKLLHAEIILHGTIASGGSSVVNTVTTFHYRRNAVVVPANKPALDTAFQAAIVVPLAAMLNNRWTQLRNTVRLINDPLDVATVFAHAAVGAIAGDSMPTEAVGKLLLRTGFRGQNYRGFKVVGPMSESDATAAFEDVWNAATIARFTTWRTALITPLVDGSPNTWTLEIVSRDLSQLEELPVNVESADVNEILLNKRITRSKRRLVKSVY